MLLTGGEPMLQREIGALAHAAPRRRLPGDDSRPSGDAPDRQLAGRGGSHRRRQDARLRRRPHRIPLDVLDGLRGQDAVKFVLTGRGTTAGGRRDSRRGHLGERTEVLLSPTHGQLDPRELVKWMLRDRLPAAPQPQLHKYIWSPDARGV